MSYNYRRLQEQINVALDEDNIMSLRDLLGTVYLYFSQGMLSAVECEHLVFLIRA